MLRIFVAGLSLFYSFGIFAQSEIDFLNLVRKGDATKVNALLVNNNFDPNLRDSSSMTALMIATKNNSLAVVRVLLSHKAYPYIQDKNGWTAMHWACLSESQLPVINVFLKNAGYPLAKTKSGKTAIDIADSTKSLGSSTALKQQLNIDFNKAITDGDLQKIRDFISGGADVNNRQHGSIQQSPLHAAVWTNQPEIIRLLLSSGAKIDAQDRNGNTPLHLAAMRGDSHIEVIKILLDSGAKQFNNKLNLSPIQLARRLEHTQTILLLMPFEEKVKKNIK